MRERFYGGGSTGSRIPRSVSDDRCEGYERARHRRVRREQAEHPLHIRPRLLVQIRLDVRPELGDLTPELREIGPVLRRELRLERGHVLLGGEGLQVLLGGERREI